MVGGNEFFRGPWHDVEWLVNTAHEFYNENVTSRGLGTIWEVSKKKIIERRKWEPSVTFYDRHMAEMLEELETFYIPKQMDPGPCVVFPLRDYREKITHGKMHPFYALELPKGVAKYGFLGKKPIDGPVFFGQSDRTLLNIARTRSVGLVEGYYDLLAARLLMPDAPILSTGTKSVNEAHIQYLRLLGVKHVRLLLDNEDPTMGRKEGSGIQAARIIKETYGTTSGMQFHIHSIRQGDAAKCLESHFGAKQLKELMTGIF